MTEKQVKQAAIVALLIWYFWPKKQEFNEEVTAQLKIDPGFWSPADWQDVIFY